MVDKHRHGIFRRSVIGVLGGVVLIVGLIAIPYPGPGWLITFAGLGILSQEFTWAKRLLGYAKVRYGRYEAWVKRQGTGMKILLGTVTTVVVVLTIYLLNGYGILNSLLNLNQDWLRSPFI